MKRIKFSLLVSSLLGFCLLSQAQANECNIAKGKKIFSKCMACHSLKPDTHLMGPSLHGVINRKAGTVSGFNYSTAMISSGILWSKSQLSDFLTQPMDKLPGTTMPFSGLRKAVIRDAVICYIEHKTNQEKS